MTSMDRAAKTGEPSMEEILASIRKIIAEEPEAGAGAATQAANPLSKSAPPSPRMEPRFPLSSDRPPPSLDRLSSALKEKVHVPEAPQGIKRPARFDDDLDDLFEETTPAVAEASRGADLAKHIERLQAERTTSPQETPAAKPSEDHPRGKIPMRKPGFYPPPGFSPALSEATARPQGTNGVPQGANGVEKPSEPAADKAVIAEEVVAAAPEPVRAAEPVAAPEVQAAHAFAHTPFNGYADAARQAAHEMAARAAAVYAEPIVAEAVPVVGPEVDATSTRAAAMALDQLAQGLAAAQGPDRREPPRYADVSPQPGGNLIVQPLMPAVTDRYGMPVRTLEDSVADMLKPMLQQWLSDNMPRIIERALRVEASRGRDRG